MSWLETSVGLRARNHEVPFTLMICVEHRLTLRYVATLDDDEHVFACPRWLDHPTT